MYDENIIAKKQIQVGRDPSVVPIWDDYFIVSIIYAGISNWRKKTCFV